MKKFLLLILASLFLLQGGCGGGGGGGIGGGNAAGGGGGGGGGVATSASGTAAFGIIKNGTVKIYALNSDGSQGNLLATTSTNGAGVYSQSLGTYNGPIIAYAYGSYVDEATGATVALTESSALRAALPSASGTVALSITGLTELAVRKAGSLTANAITGANSAISSIFKVDITGVSPIEASAAVMGAAGVTPQQRDYTLALAAMSQMATTASGATAGEKLGSLLNTLTQGIDGSSLNAAAAAAFTQSLHVYLQNHGDINTVVANSGGSPIITVGSPTGIVTITLATPAGISGATLTLNLPAGVTVHSQADSSVSNAVVGLTPATANAMTLGKFTPATGSAAGSLTIGLVSGTPVPSGAVLIINADVAPGTTVTKESFSITGTTLVDQNSGTAVPGASLAVSGVTVQ